MKVLGINGSPRIGGNTDILLDKALDGARTVGAETEKIFLNGLKFVPCQEEEYGDVKEDGLSVIEDEMQSIYPKIEKTDALILASPIFFGSLTAQIKMMIDRFQCVWVSKNVFNKDIFTKKKAGAFICAEASQRKDFFENAKFIVKHFFSTLNAAYSEELFCPGVDKKGSVLKHPEYLTKSFELGKRIGLFP